jgi:hypothetical protein
MSQLITGYRDGLYVFGVPVPSYEQQDSTLK